MASKVKLKILCARTDGTGAGSIIEVGADEAKRLVDKGHAEPVATPRKKSTKKPAK